ncbi:hypothetical protein BT96DRAFT_584408 [Gymnopus androsaceus JB14]|uniref:Uncharacterized protein n=1 Tax=Gymnopus androsaceus JB14 TaxID=1447944 RepID=A0A6A4IAN9_9AGAR|nr:hypothetical protein BT96DRAFT_584408 [Gymnopus androsaceus JB14]
MSSTNDTSGSLDNAHTTPTSATTTSLSPTWAPPKAPLPPHRLAKLANALGVSTPIPVYKRQERDRTPSPYLIPSPSFPSAQSLNTPDAYASIRDAYASLRRSPTPSSAGSIMNSGTPYTFTSKFLLHVIPPMYLPHNSQLLDNVPSGSGYHSQFRRGTLVPVHPTLQAQLWAIAKEYSLPSTTGIVLYLVNSTSTPSDQNTPTGAEGEDESEPGPRLSDDIWRHLWTRVWKAERDEMLLPPHALAGTLSSLEVDSDSPIPVSPLRPFMANGGNRSETALSQAGSYPSPSTPSSASTLAFRSRSPMSDGPGTDTPPTSHSNSLDSTDSDVHFLRANSLPLPGLNSPSLMPILAKVEFDIDRRKAGWYEPWAKRRKVRKGKEKSNTSADDLPKRLKLTGRAQTASPVSLFSLKDQTNTEGYEPLSDDDESEEEEEDIGDENETARVLSTSGPDLKGSRPRIKKAHDLALTAEDLDEDEDEPEDDNLEQSELTKGAEEISQIMAQMGSPIDRPNSVSRKHIPPPLVLHPAGGATSKELNIPSPLNSANSLNGQASSSSLPYLKGVSPDELSGVKYEDDLDAENDSGEGYAKLKNPHETEKRIGGVYDDFDLGEFDENDPHDRRRSQYILSAELDKLERNLAQLSPRALKMDLESEQPIHSPGSPYLGLPSSGHGTPVLLNSDVLPPTPRKESFKGDSNATPTSPQAQWPAVPFSSLNEESEDRLSFRRSRAESASTSPPRLALNGASTFAPNAFRRQDSLGGRSGSISVETLQRRKEAEEEKLFYPSMNRSSSAEGDSNSPVIPLSPDPFGRFSSTPEFDGNRQNIKVWDAVPVGGSVDKLIKNSQQRQSQAYKETAPRTSEASSRFSADSSKDHIELPPSITQSVSGSSTTSAGSRESLGKSGSRSTVISMKGIKKLWRKSNKNSVSSIPSTPIPESPAVPFFGPPADDGRSLNPSPTPTIPSGRAPSPHSLENLPQPSAVPIRPSRPSKDELYIPDIPEQLAMPLHPENGRPAPMPIIAAQMQAGLQSRPAGGDRMRFDQESPYPMPSKRPPPRKMSVSMNNVPTTDASSNRAPSPANSMMSKANVRKSILKWKAAAAAQQNGEPSDPSGPPRSSMERTTSNGIARPRAPSLSTGSRPSSSSISDIPPSPSIPEHFLSSRGPAEHLRTGSHLTTSSTDSKLTSVTDVSSFLSLNSPSSSQTSYGSPPLQTDLAQSPSLGSNAKLGMDSDGLRKMSLDSQSDRLTVDDDDSESRPSIDSSQFEMVSPKMKLGTLSYPYTTVGMHNDS